MKIYTLFHNFTKRHPHAEVEICVAVQQPSPWIIKVGSYDDITSNWNHDDIFEKDMLI